MEMAGFFLLVASLGLFLTECVADTPMALSRIRSAVALPILGYSIATIVSAFVMLENVDDQLAALRELKGPICFCIRLFFRAIRRCLVERIFSVIFVFGHHPKFVRYCPILLWLGASSRRSSRGSSRELFPGYRVIQCLAEFCGQHGKGCFFHNRRL